MEAKCPKCGTPVQIRSESHVAGGKARAKLWTFEQRSTAMKKSWQKRKQNREAEAKNQP
jgi:hypothetical protein